jgi:hypothetical protein
MAKPAHTPVIHAKGRLGALCLRRIFQGDMLTDNAAAVTCEA